MNISAVAREALIPIEQEIMSKPVEHAYQLDKAGMIIFNNEGNASSATVFTKKDNFILTHNHPESFVDTTALSPEDIVAAIDNLFHEFRAITSDGFCHLVEVPKLKTSIKNQCHDILHHYVTMAEIFSGFSLQSHRKMRKELEKVGGLKFRTIKLP